MEIETAVKEFLKDRKPDSRYASFDYCYNYFYGFHKKGVETDIANSQNIQMSCTQLMCYLASWGMLRGSSILLQRSARHYVPLIHRIADMTPKLWDIDVGSYTEENIYLLLRCKNQIREALGDNPSDTLVTKIMLGIFGNVPAYDQNFRRSLGVHTFNKDSLLKIKGFYEENKGVIDSFRIPTLEFMTGRDTENFYTKAKVVDMYGFIAREPPESKIIKFPKAN